MSVPATVAGTGSDAELVLVGRQPIFDRAQSLYAYELLFRSGETGAGSDIDDERATAYVLSNTFLEIGFDQIVGSAKAFINCPRSVLVQECHLPPDRVVLEVIERLQVDSELVQGCRARKEQGFAIALDDFVPSATWEALVDLADFVKIDVLATPEDELEAMVERLRPRGPRLLAEKVETGSQYETLRELGFEYFQGYFLSRPEVVSGRRISANRLAALEMLGELQRPDVTPRELEAIIARDVALSYKLMKLVNSAAMGLPRRVDSLRQTVILLGLETLRHWAMLLALNAVENPPLEVNRNALTRAKMCELLGRAVGTDRADTYFLVGLLSSLEAFLRVPLAEALSYIPLTDECTEALLERRGELGAALGCTLAHETWDWERARYARLAPGQITGIFAEASVWGHQSCRGLDTI